MIVQAVWPFDRCKLNCSTVNIAPQGSKYLHSWINWSFSLRRLDTGDWKIIPTDVLPVTVILEVLILICKSVKWMAKFCDNIPHSHFHKSSFYSDMLIVISEGVHSMTSKGHRKAMISSPIDLFKYFQGWNGNSAPRSPTRWWDRCLQMCDFTCLKHQLFATL